MINCGLCGGVHARGYDCNPPVKVVRMVTTEYVGSTDTSHSRIRVKHLTTKKRIFVPWASEYDTDRNHQEAAAKLLGRKPEFGCSVDGGGYIFGVDPANDPQGEP